MSLFTAKKSIMSLISGVVLFTAASTSHAASQTFDCVGCDATTFLMGSISHEGTDWTTGWDWTDIVTNDGQDGTLFTGGTFNTPSTSDAASITDAYTVQGVGTITTMLITGLVDVAGFTMTFTQETPFRTVTGTQDFELRTSAVPVPAAAFLFAPALLGFMGLRRKKSI